MSIEKLLEIMTRLRSPHGGCPWDREQTFATIAPYTIEEAYEVADAIERDALDELEDELGDLLFQVVFHARLAEEAGAFAFGDVVAAICTKLTRRHPHVFGDAEIADARDQAAAWERLKAAERSAQQGVLDDVPLGLPALTRGAKLGRRAAQVGFDWPDLAGVRAKLAEEVDELDAAIAQGERERISAELGDVLFALVNLGRHLDIDPEASLRSTNARFQRRFEFIERAVAHSEGGWEDFDLAALDRLWDRAKSEAG
jgi:tetrapyrrole methylase family protein/MazG family protein/ATP diphosphatase